jgi:hypothetical protein
MYVKKIIKKREDCFFTCIFLDDSKHKLSKHKISDSIQSIRSAVHRFPKPHLSSSRTSVNSDQKSQAEISDTTSLKVPHDQHKPGTYPTWSSG